MKQLFLKAWLAQENIRLSSAFKSVNIEINLPKVNMLTKEGKEPSQERQVRASDQKTGMLGGYAHKDFRNETIIAMQPEENT